MKDSVNPKPFSYIYQTDNVYSEIKQTCTQETSFCWNLWHNYINFN